MYAISTEAPSSPKSTYFIHPADNSSPYSVQTSHSMNWLKLVKKFKFFIPMTSTDWWNQFREWEQLCCPQHTTVRLVFLFLFFLLMELAVLVITLLYIPSRMHTGSFFLDSGVPALLIIAVVGSIVKISHMIAQRRRIGVISSTMQRFDQTLQRLDFRLRCNELVYWTSGWSITFMVTTILFSIMLQMFGLVVFKHVGPTVMLVLINVSNVPYTVFTIWFMVCELCVWCRMKLLHSLLEGGMRSMATSKRMEMVKRPSHVLAGLTDLHADLSSIVYHVNATFGVQVTVTLAAYTFLLIFCIFSYYRAAVVMGESETTFAWLMVCWSLYNSCFQIPKVWFGAWIRQWSDKFTKLIHHHLRHANDPLLQNQVSCVGDVYLMRYIYLVTGSIFVQLFILAQQSEHYSLTIRSWIYTLNWPVYASIIGYISTYVVILIQFDSKALDI